VSRALILGTLAGQVDAVEALRARGVEVHTCGHRAEGPGVTAADAFHLVDITDIDAVAALAEREEYDLVYSVGSDIAMPTVTAVSERLGLPLFHGSALTAVLRQKHVMRERLAHLPWGSVENLTVPPGGSVEGWSTYPAIVKPDDSQGQRGITIVHDGAALASAVAFAREHSRGGVVVVEQLLQGPEVSAHVVVADGEPTLILPSDRHVWDGPLVGIPRAHTIEKPDPEFHAVVTRLVTECVEALGVREGPLYFQMIVTGKGPRVVEIASRLDGCHLWRLIKLSTGVDLLDAVLGRLLGEPWPTWDATANPQPMTLEFFLDSPDTVVTEELRSALTDPNAAFVEWQVDDGTAPRRTNDVVARLGYQVRAGT